MLVQSQRAKKRRELLSRAQALYLQSKDWVSFFRQTLGVQGFVHSAFNTTEEATEFEQSEEFREISQMVAQLRNNRRRKKKRKGDDREPTKVITVRMPKSLHELLAAQATQRGISINNLCIGKLLQMIEAD